MKRAFMKLLSAWNPNFLPEFLLHSPCLYHIVQTPPSLWPDPIMQGSLCRGRDVCVSIHPKHPTAPKGRPYTCPYTQFPPPQRHP